MMPAMLMISMVELTHGADAVDVARAQAHAWRASHRLIDLHQHINLTTQHLARAVKIMDRSRRSASPSISARARSPADGRRALRLRTRQSLDGPLYPGRFLHYMILDYAGWDARIGRTRASRRSRKAIGSARPV